MRKEQEVFNEWRNLEWWSDLLRRLIVSDPKNYKIYKAMVKKVTDEIQTLIPF